MIDTLIRWWLAVKAFGCLLPFLLVSLGVVTLAVFSGYEWLADRTWRRWRRGQR